MSDAGKPRLAELWGRARLRAARMIGEKTFGLWQALGFHVVPVDYYQPIPDTRRLPDALWERPSEMPGVEMNRVGQVALLESFRERFKAEYDALPASQTADPLQFYEDNVYFRSGDAEILYCLVRSLKPRRMIEIGSGLTTLLAAQALRKNREEGAPECEFVAIEPYPNATLRAGVPGLTRLVERPVQAAPLEEFLRFGENDILFIDSSHVLRIGSDVQYEFLEILPRLRPGVAIHVHDVFLPFEYPKKWVKRLIRFWNEQYLLQAFLAFNREFEILWAGSYMRHVEPERLEAAFAKFTRATRVPGSLWMRRVG